MWGIFNQESFVKTGKESCNLRTYGTINTKIGREKNILSINISNLNERIVISKIP